MEREGEGFKNDLLIYFKQKRRQNNFNLLSSGAMLYRFVPLVLFLYTPLVHAIPSNCLPILTDRQRQENPNTIEIGEWRQLHEQQIPVCIIALTEAGFAEAQRIQNIRMLGKDRRKILDRNSTRYFGTIQAVAAGKQELVISLNIKKNDRTMAFTMEGEKVAGIVDDVVGIPVSYVRFIIPAYRGEVRNFGKGQLDLIPETALGEITAPTSQEPSKTD